jgi:hypothetical protein
VTTDNPSRSISYRTFKFQVPVEFTTEGPNNNKRLLLSY